eukprot:2247114-Prymnesium_polylepis.1
MSSGGCITYAVTPGCGELPGGHVSSSYDLERKITTAENHKPFLCSFQAEFSKVGGTCFTTYGRVSNDSTMYGPSTGFQTKDTAVHQWAAGPASPARHNSYHAGIRFNIYAAIN